ncbi:hypothetical protein [Veillonella sp.]|uniref:hypothetical protein n=1 Tax=Veillonella sp. TaxID=1926307 RepID=UPI00257A5734|nr:hypothetical protein [Veillonella sp.]MBS6227749.1 hypothetical protein [Veillonella sp.]
MSELNVHVKYDALNALYDLFNGINSNVFDLYKDDWQQKLDMFRGNIEQIQSSLDIVSMLMVWLVVNPNDEAVVRTFIDQHHLKGKLYGGLVRLLSSKHYKIRPCIDDHSHKFLYQAIDRQYMQCHHLEYSYKFLFILVDILHDIDIDKYINLLGKDNTYWLVFHHIIKYRNSYIDTLLCSTDFVTASIAFYSLTQYLSSLITKYNNKRLENQNLEIHSLSGDNLSLDEIEEKIERLYQAICDRLQLKKGPHLCELLMYHVLEINRVCHVTGQLLLNDTLIQLLFSNSSLENMKENWKQAICGAKELLIFFETLQVARLALDELNKYYRLGIQILTDLIKNGSLLLIGNSSVKRSVSDYEYIKVVIGMLSDSLKIELKTILITYRDSLYVSSLDLLVRNSLYIRDVSRYETIQNLLKFI